MTKAESTPLLSVVIPVFNRPIALAGMLGALLRQVAEVERELDATCEIIVADDGSPVDVQAGVLGALDAGAQTRLRWVRMPRNGGRSAARNAGAALARGARLLFLDCDSYPGADLLARHCAVAAGERDAVLVGRRLEVGWAALEEMVAGEGREPRITAFEEDFRVSYLGFDDDLPGLPDSPAPWLNAYSHNISVPRELFAQVGGFDEEMRRWGHEDIELGLRLFKAGATFRYDRAAYCAHLPHGRDFRGDATGAEDNLTYIKRKHPMLDTELLGSDTYTNIERKIGYYRAAIRSLADRPGIRATATDVLDELDLVAAAGSTLWIGHDLQVKPRDEDVVVDHGDGDGLLGLDTPFAGGQFDVTVNVDLWRLLPVWDLCLAVAEGLRVARAVVLVDSRRPAGPADWAVGTDYVVEALSTKAVLVDAVRGARLDAVVLRPAAP